MRKKSEPTKVEEIKDPAKLNLQKDVDDKRTNVEFIADALLEGGSISNSCVIQSFHLNGNDLDLDACIRTLKVTAKKVNDGDNADLEGMLSAQAMALNSVFTSLATRANNANLMPHMETFMRFALKAQHQCRATIDTLAQIRNPRQTVITKQANISNGQQQVNNTLHQGIEQQFSSLKNSETEQNKLFAHEEERSYMDTRTESQTSGDYPAMAALGNVNRADNRRRESQSSA